MHPLRHATRFHFPYFPIARNGKYRKCCVRIFEVQRLCVSSMPFVRVCECVDVCMFTSNGEQLCVLFTLSLALSAARSLRLRFPLRMFVCWFGEATVSVLNDEPTNRLVACMHRTKRSCKQFKISVPSSHTYFAVRSNNSREFVFFLQLLKQHINTTHKLNHTKSICFHEIIHRISLAHTSKDN